MQFILCPLLLMCLPLLQDLPEAPASMPKRRRHTRQKRFDFCMTLILSSVLNIIKGRHWLGWGFLSVTLKWMSAKLRFTYSCDTPLSLIRLHRAHKVTSWLLSGLESWLCGAFPWCCCLLFHPFCRRLLLHRLFWPLLQLFLCDPSLCLSTLVAIATCFSTLSSSLVPWRRRNCWLSLIHFFMASYWRCLFSSFTSTIPRLASDILTLWGSRLSSFSTFDHVMSVWAAFSSEVRLMNHSACSNIL